MSTQPTVSDGDRTTTTEIRFHNTMSGKTEPFVPLTPGVVRSYTCGPTVYDFAHIGNFSHVCFLGFAAAVFEVERVSSHSGDEPYRRGRPNYSEICRGWRQH